MTSDLQPFLRAPLPALTSELGVPVLQHSVAITRRTVIKMRVPQSPPYVWCFWLLITLLVVSTVPAYAGWMVIEKDYFSPGLWTIYVDPDSIRREGNLVKVRQLVNFKAMQGGRNPTRFWSATTHKQFDCVEKRLRLLAFTEFLAQWEPVYRLMAT